MTMQEHLHPIPDDHQEIVRVEDEPLEKSDESQKKKQEWQKKEEVGKKQDEQMAKRLIESPDLREALNALRPQLRIVKAFLDKTLQWERSRQAQNRVVMIPEFRRAIDELNRQIADLRNARGLRFRAVDVWAAINDMAMSPDSISLRFPPPPRHVLVEYLRAFGRDGSLYSGVEKHMQINAERFDLIDDHTRTAEQMSVVGIDTILFRLRVQGGLDQDRSEGASIDGMLVRDQLVQLSPGWAPPRNYWTDTIVQRARAYGMLAGSSTLEDSAAICIDLHSGLQGTGSGGRYLLITPRNDGADRFPLSTQGISLTNDPPPDFIRLR